MTDPQLNRRKFLKTTGAVGAGSILGAPAILSQENKGQKLRVAFVGTDGRGGAHVGQAAQMKLACNCYCDVDSNRWGNAKKNWPKAKGYQDYREMFDKEAKNFDAVFVATPDHHHYPAAIRAMTLGKHAYVEKPLTHTVWEARQLTLAAKKYKLATQMGNQGHANKGNRLMVEWYRSGVLGEIKEVHCWTNRPVWPQPVKTPTDSDPVPANLNWDCWLGAAPERPFKNKVYHSFVWRGWWDFGAGALGDMACHTMDAFFWSMQPGAPESVELINATEMFDGNFPKQSTIKYRFPAKGDRPAFDFFWHDGNRKPSHPAHLAEGRKLPNTGTLFVGANCSILSAGDYGDSPRIIPEPKMQEVAKAMKEGKREHMVEPSPGHHQEFVMAASGEKPIDFPGSNFSYAGPFSEVVLLGNVALRVPGKLMWDSKKLKVTNKDEANKFINKQYRKGWEPIPV